MLREGEDCFLCVSCCLLSMASLTSSSEKPKNSLSINADKNRRKEPPDVSSPPMERHKKKNPKNVGRIDELQMTRSNSKSQPLHRDDAFFKKKINDLSLPFKKFVIHRCNRRLPHRQHRKNGRIKDTTRGLIHKESPSSNQNGGSPSFYFLKKLHLSLSI